jgi:TetR/AcrR family transcriptional regulator, transcriptional repressor for nem operon
MRYSSDHKARTRDRILQVAAAAIRTHGIDRVSLSDVMSGAELTNGGFYSHFKSKDDLVAEAIAFMFDERYAGFLARVDTPDAKQALNTFIDYYLSMRHRDARERGCPIPALATDVPHMSRDARNRFSAGVSRLIEALAILLDHAGVADPQVQANSLLAELAGALSLARTAEQPADAKTRLAASRFALKQRFGLIACA